ncbi:MAG: TrkA family potassium uptake protein [Actinomycetota bacterium]|nr:TrkA family potassium uptake protein [Actinomycetota bacterium]
MHIVVVGCGRVGSELATTLSAAGHEVVIVDKQEVAFRRLTEEFTGSRVVGLGFDRDTLAAAGVGEAAALAAVTSGDNSNVLTARIAREYFHVPNVVARIYDPRRAVIYQRLGIPTVATVTWTVDQVVRRLLPDQPVTEWVDATGQVVLIERSLAPAWVGRSLDELEVPDASRLVSVTRGGSPRLARPGLIGQEGDVVHLAVRKDRLDQVRRELGELA